MQRDDEIFNTYALLRLTEDSNIVLSDFPSLSSSSLNYLSKISGVSLIPANKGKWVRDNDPVQPEIYEVEDISSDELVQKRAQNIENIIQKFSSALGQRIKLFELYTKDYHVLEKGHTPETIASYQKALELLPTNPTNDAALRAKKALEQRISKIKEAFRPKTDPFYETIREIYNERNLLAKADLLKTLYYHMVDKRDTSDVQEFLKRRNVSSDRFHNELKYNIAQQIQRCFRLYGGRQSDVDFWQQELDYLAPKVRKYKTKLLGKDGAFSMGGIYGPDSKFILANQPVLNTIDTSKTSLKNVAAAKSSVHKPKKAQKVVELLLFSDKDFEY